jgi:hypothetical protein
MNKLKEIYDGWKNYTFPTPEIESLAKYRAAICCECDELILGICIKCICPNVGKIRSPTSFCSIGKWFSIEEENKQTTVIDNKNSAHVPMDTFKTSNEYINYLNNTNDYEIKT